jgi:branched-chain amino acid transport system permease protein
MKKFRWKPFVVLIVLMCYSFVFFDTFKLMLMTTAGIYCIVTIGLCLLIGYAGQISLGHAAFFAIGGYTTAILTTRYGWPDWGSLPAAVAIAAAIAFLIGLPTLKLRGHYLAMATLAFGEIVYQLINSNVELTGGSSGIFGVPPLTVSGFNLSSDQGIYYFLTVWITVIVLMLLADNLIRSRPGRALMSIHGNEEAANASGVNTFAFKLKIFVLSAALAALAGFLYAHNDGFIGVDSSAIMLSVIFVAMVAVGGMANLWGVLAATVLISLLPEFLRGFQKLQVSDLPGFLSTTFKMSEAQLMGLIQKLQELDILIYGAIIIIIMIFMPRGIFAGTADLIKNIIAGARRMAGKNKEKESAGE